jgi:hypothetical protein
MLDQLTVLAIEIMHISPKMVLRSWGFVGHIAPYKSPTIPVFRTKCVSPIGIAVAIFPRTFLWGREAPPQKRPRPNRRGYG